MMGVWKTVCTFVLLLLILPDPTLNTALNHLASCSPSSYQMVLRHPILVLPLDASYAYSPFIILQSNSFFPEMSLTHEAYHFTQDTTGYWQDPHTRFEIELAANTSPYAEEVRANCR